MKILVIGGSGLVGSLTLPHLAQQHRLRIFDLQPPTNGDWEYVAGNINDLAALCQAAVGMDALLYMAMGNKDFETQAAITTNFDVNIKGVYHALYAAHQAGITHAVYTSSMSVYEGDLLARYFHDEDLPPDATGLYGFTKRLGEEVCRNATRTWGLSVNALRLCFPVPEAEWRNPQRTDTIPLLATLAEDVASAILAALAYRAGFQAFMISGDDEQKILNMSKAKRLLGWAPHARV